MTGIEIRDTQFASWSDPDAWMEIMKGTKWSSVLQEESAFVKKVTENPKVKDRLGKFQAAYRSAKEKAQHIQFQVNPITVTWHNVFFKEWNFSEDSTNHLARDIVVHSDTVWCTEDVGDGAESMELQAWSSKKKAKPLWKKYPVGPDIGLIGKKLYYLGVKNKLVYHELWCCDAMTGKHEKCIYRERSVHANLSLEKHGDGRLKLIREDSQDSTVFEILLTGSFLRRNSKYPIPGSWIVPLAQPYGIDFAWQSQGILVIKRHGASTIWKCKPHTAPKKLLEIEAGHILFDPFAVWAGIVPTTVYITRPDVGSIQYVYNGDTVLLEKPVQPTGLRTRRFHARSKDGTTVHGIVTYKAHSRPVHLLTIGYGAYGMPTSVGSVVQRWAPLVYSGWAIVHTFLRGGGDHTEEWAKAGRLEGRIHTIDDFVALVKTAQSYFQIGPSHTVIYGRSAGGLLVGDTLNRYPEGTLMRGVYAEVPYVDELRTTTNPELPLTELEANEFGYPSQRLEDFIQVALLSPADSAITLKTPKILVLTRTAENDSQVFAYESVKWIRRLRAAQGPNGAPKLCIVEKDQGHFALPEDTLEQWPLDAAILDTWIHNEL